MGSEFKIKPERKEEIRNLFLMNKLLKEGRDWKIKEKDGKMVLEVGNMDSKTKWAFKQAMLMAGMMA